MKLSVKNIEGQDTGEFEVQFPVIENGKGTQAVHDTIVAYLAAQRSGTACTKTRAEVAGPGRKPWRQKGTGRARAGTFASPLWRGGGVVFGPKPRDYTKKVNRTTRKLALRKAISERLMAEEIVVVDDIKLEASKTKSFIKFLRNLSIESSVLVVTNNVDSNLRLATRNLPDVDVATSADINTYQILKYDKLLFNKDAFQELEKRLV
ncbi:MAG: 50S ribosomal protein L4 [Verrucomicrobia bacterium]|nr:50S ribosomal protein L4 [Verrucomicrobiota bacterium]MCF7707816.1 50S ribosomal protein L4 [Verrucomicrobiota bacterium]